MDKEHPFHVGGRVRCTCGCGTVGEVVDQHPETGSLKIRIIRFINPDPDSVFNAAPGNTIYLSCSECELYPGHKNVGKED